MNEKSKNLQERLRIAAERLRLLKFKESKELNLVLSSKRYKLSLISSIIFLAFIFVFLSDWFLNGNYMNDKISYVKKEKYTAPSRILGGITDIYWIIRFENYTELEIEYSKYLHPPKAGDLVKIEKSWLLNQPKSMHLQGWEQKMETTNGIFSHEKTILFFLTFTVCLVLLIYSKSGFVFISDFALILLGISILTITYTLLKYS